MIDQSKMFETPQVVVSVGRPKKGKSNSVKWMILKNSVDNKHFKYGQRVYRCHQQI